MKEVVDAIYTKLSSATGAGTFHGLLDGRYYHIQAPQNSAFPMAVYAIDGMDNEDQFGGARIMRGSVSFDIFVESRVGAAVAMQIEESLFTLLDQSILTTGGSYGLLSVQCISRGVPSLGDEFIVIPSTYSLFTSRTA